MASKQSVTIDYIVTGELDGVTPAPEVTPGLTPVDPDNQIYQIATENLGVIDPDLGIGGSIGPRCLTLLGFLFGGVIPTGGGAQLGAVFGDDILPLGQVLPFGPEPSAGTFGPIFVPQGGVILVDGVQAGTNPIVVRITVDVPTDPCELLALIEIAGQDGGDAIPPGIDPATFVGGPGATLGEMLNRMASLLAILNGGPIP